MSITKQETFSRVVLSWDDEGNPKGASGERLIRFFEDGELISTKRGEPENILKEGFPLQDFLSAAQETAILKALEVAEEKEAMEASLSNMTSERDTLVEQLNGLNSQNAVLSEENSILKARIEELEGVGD